MSKHDLRERVAAIGRIAYHCDGCDPTHIVAAYPITHIRGGQRLCGECAEEHDRRELSGGKRHGRCMSCTATSDLELTMSDLWQCSDCIEFEARVRSEQRQ